MSSLRVTRHPIVIFLFWFSFTFLVSRSLMGCSMFEKVPPRSVARGAVVVTAEAVRLFSETCARYVMAEEDLDLAIKCRDAYASARISMIALASGIDAWEKSETTRQSIICSLRSTLSILYESVKILEAHNIPQKTYDDALVLVATLGGCQEVRP